MQRPIRSRANWSRNFRKFAADAKSRGAQLAVFSELCLCGYPPQDLIERPSFLKRNLDTLKKLAARHKVGFGFAAALVLLIAVFAVVVSIQAGRIARERDRANREAQISKQVADFMRTLFQAPDPYEGKGKEVTARENLRALADTVEAWVIEHVLDEDRRLAAFIRSQSQGARLAADAAGP